MSPSRRFLLAESLLCLALAWAALLIFPFRHVAARLGDLMPPETCSEPTPAPGEEVTLAANIGWAVSRMAAHVPFRAVCLQQAIAAKIMLRRRGIKSALYFGVAPADAPAGLKAHAWLDAASVKVTGYPAAGRYTKIACFL